jgi:hypothetical protein
LEFERTLFNSVDVVQDHEAAGWLHGFEFTEIDRLHGEGCHGSTITEMSTAERHILVELVFFWDLVLVVVTSSANLKHDSVLLLSINIFNFDG